MRALMIPHRAPRLAGLNSVASLIYNLLYALSNLTCPHRVAIQVKKLSSFNTSSALRSTPLLQSCKPMHAHRGGKQQVDLAIPELAHDLLHSIGKASASWKRPHQGIQRVHQDRDASAGTWYMLACGGPCVCGATLHRYIHGFIFDGSFRLQV